MRHNSIMAKGLKRKTWDWMSKYIRLRDSIAYCKEVEIPLDSGVGRCCTCGKIIPWKQADAGHFISRGSGGASGVYFDERNSNFQCRSCNRFNQGSAQEYNDFMLKKYGQDVIDELRMRNKVIIRKNSVILLALHQYYKEAYQELLDSL